MTVRAWLTWCLLGVVSCAPGGVGTPSLPTTRPSPTTVIPTSSAPIQLAPCPLPEVVIGVPPSTVSDSQAIASDYADVFTSIPGTSQTVFANDDGTPAMAVIRGSLPPTNWVGATERFEIRAVTAALGPLADGMWAVAWAESAERCDLYSVLIYPPGTVEDARRVADSIR